jgi:hypothetical protein
MDPTSGGRTFLARDFMGGAPDPKGSRSMRPGEPSASPSLMKPRPNPATLDSMNAASGDKSARGPMTAKERLLEEAPGWAEEQARQAFAAATGRIIDDWGDLDAWAASSSLHALRMLDAEDAAAGFSWEDRGL